MGEVTREDLAAMTDQELFAMNVGTTATPT